VDFPLFEWDEDAKDWAAAHHMFTMPKPEHVQYLTSDPGKVIAQCYDIVLNGVEMASGSIRVHRQDIQREIMRAMHISEDQVKIKFGFLLEAFTYGAPPHGGFAIGLDRFCAMLEGQSDIREYIAFPKNKQAECPMDGSPTQVDSAQMDMLGLSLKKL
jgi:aspartyl-tRNA synthetase